VIAWLLSDSSAVLTEPQRQLLLVPVVAVMGYQLLASVLMLVGVYHYNHYLLLPFQASCVRPSLQVRRSLREF
jgi:hypothetical protein